MSTPHRLLTVAALGATSVLALAACSATASDESTANADATINVVASTNVYGQIAEEIGADAVTVTSIIESGAQDPHEYESTAQDQLAVSEADVIIENGGGYDSFIDGLIESTGTTAHVITAVEFNHSYEELVADGTIEEDEHDHSEEEHDHVHIEGFNEHVWYDPHTMEHLAEAIAAEFAELDPANAEVFEANAAEFIEGIEGLEASLDEVAATDAGAEVFVTEPVPVYLTAAAGLENVTPEEFSEAVEEGQDVPAATLLESIELLESGSVRVVITNGQVGGAETTQVIATAEEQGIPVIEFTETLPEGETYISWMQNNIAELQAALAS
ncbi:zinc ABC transporter substrate-binding protein [Microbacterium sediminicola]|uniref:Zinc ABC transporter substrate-binding protein n=1 Tax=Microbacterium sediminicola TaxID=415210 RepID=A0ABN2ICP8_9MICO